MHFRICQRPRAYGMLRRSKNRIICSSRSSLHRRRCCCCRHHQTWRCLDFSQPLDRYVLLLSSLLFDVLCFECEYFIMICIQWQFTSHFFPFSHSQCSFGFDVCIQHPKIHEQRISLISIFHFSCGAH